MVKLADHARGESGADQPALPEVVRAIHTDQHGPGNAWLVTQLRSVESTEEIWVVAGCLNVLVLRQHPESLVVVACEGSPERTAISRVHGGAGR